MLINLFKSEQVIKNSNQLGKQIMTRGIQVEKNLKRLDEIVSDNPEFQRFKNECFSLEKTSRVYENILSNSYDSHFSLEMLGVAKYARQYTIVVDFSDALDFLLSVLSDSDPENIRKIINYDRISRNILRFELGECEDVSISELFNADRNLVRWLDELTYNQRESIRTVDLQDAAYSILFSFYTELQKTLEETKDYVGTYLQKIGLRKAVYRSKGKTAIVVSSDDPLEEGEPLELAYGERKITLPCYSFKPFEYAELLGGGSIEYIR